MRRGRRRRPIAESEDRSWIHQPDSDASADELRPTRIVDPRREDLRLQVDDAVERVTHSDARMTAHDAGYPREPVGTIGRVVDGPPRHGPRDPGTRLEPEGHRDLQPPSDVAPERDRYEHAGIDSYDARHPKA